eukprot:3612546-Heterocapsa_arctica.AAC.1
MRCNLTTNEHVRDYYIDRNPFDISCWENYRQILCAPYSTLCPNASADNPSSSSRSRGKAESPAGGGTGAPTATFPT